MASRLQLRVDELTINRNLKAAAATLYKLDTLKLPSKGQNNLLRQTSGSFAVLSLLAVYDLYFHIASYALWRHLRS